MLSFIQAMLCDFWAEGINEEDRVELHFLVKHNISRRYWWGELYFSWANGVKNWKTKIFFHRFLFVNFRCTRVRRRQTAHGKVDGCEWYKIKLNLLCLMQAAHLIFHVFIIDHTFTWSLPFLLVRLFVMLSLLALTCFKVIYSRVKWENCEQRSLLMCFLFCFLTSWTKTGITSSESAGYFLLGAQLWVFVLTVPMPLVNVL